MEDGNYVDGSVWFYAPNKSAPIFFALAFLVSGASHFWQAVHYSSWRLTGLYVLCAVIFIGGFVMREVGAFFYGNLDVYIASICLVYAAPPFYELGNYYILGRILYYVPYYSPIHPGRVLTTFAAISAVVEALNGNGAAYMVNQSLPQDKRDLGKALLKTALLLQIVVVGLFLSLAAFFHRRCIRNGVKSSRIENPLLTLYLSSGFITTRTIYRIVEYFDVSNIDFSDTNLDPSSLSPIIRYEWFFYVFEATLMLANSVLLNMRHPRLWLPKSTKIYLAKDSITEVEGPGYTEDRSFLATLIDPFDLWGLFRGNDHKSRFWEMEGTG